MQGSTDKSSSPWFTWSTPTTTPYGKIVQIGPTSDTSLACPSGGFCSPSYTLKVSTQMKNP